MLTVIVSVLHLQFSQLGLLFFVFETSLVVGDTCPSEVVKFVIMFKTHYMLIIVLVFLYEQQLLLRPHPFGGSSYIVQKFSRHLDVVLDFVSNTVYNWLFLPQLLLSSYVLQTTELIHL